MYKNKLFYSEYFTSNTKFSQLRSASPLSTPFPKIIWSFWHDDNPPLFVKKCFESWKRFNPDYEIRILSSNNLKNYIDEDLTKLKMVDTNTRLSDFIRLAVLAKYGGIWCDASIACTQSFDEWIQNNKLEEYGFVCYHLGGWKRTHPVIESWFFLCTKGNCFVEEWRKEFMRTNNFNSIKEYLEDLKIKGVNFQGIPSIQLERLCIHASAQYVLQKKNIKIDVPGYTNSIRCIPSDEKDVGPMYYIVSQGWNILNALNNLCKDSSLISKPIIKFRSIERRYDLLKYTTCLF